MASNIDILKHLYALKNNNGICGAEHCIDNCPFRQIYCTRQYVNNHIDAEILKLKIKLI